VTGEEMAARDPRVGSEVDRYTIVRLLGRGGMGAVYEARHTRLGRRAAIKFLLPDLADRAEILRRFENEAVAAGGLEHPNLVAVNDLGRAADGAPYLVMEFLAGEDCARLLRQVGPLPAARAANLVLQACRGVAVAHDAGIVHRDLKPENLFLADAGDGSDHVKVLDFGIAKLRPAGGEAMTRTGSTFGTTHYMSPEQARGASEVDVRTDVWSLGVVLYELLAGRKPFDAEQPLGVVHQILNATAPPLDTLRPGLPRGLVAAVEKALKKDAAERFPSIRAFAQALVPFASRPAVEAAGQAQTATRPTPVTAAGEVQRRSRLGLLVGTGLALAAVGAIVAAFSILNARGTPAAQSAAPAPIAAPAPSVAAPVPTPPPPAPAPAPAAAQAPSEGSESSGHARRADLAAAAGRRPRSKPAETSAPKPAERSETPARPSLKLDPNPY
jgi:serine/threonine-protein kinase